MNEHTIHLSEPAYRLLLEQATHRNITPEMLIERLLQVEVAESLVDTESVSSSQEEALAAVHRLTTLFADVQIDDLEELLNDPMLELINVDLN
jgi:hypothetical protein